MAVGDLREAYRLCRELKERSIVTWTASALAKALADAGETGLAREVLLETAPLASSEGPAPATWLLDAEAEILLAEGDRDGALEKALRLLADMRAEGIEKEVAAQVVWIAVVFGDEAAGGAGEAARARELLERLNTLQAFRAAALVATR